MTLDRRIAILSDIHGEYRTLERVLDACQLESVDRLILLGDMVDRKEQVEPFLRRLVGWRVSGVLGNHDREVLEGTDDIASQGGINYLFDDRANDELRLHDAIFVHDGLHRSRAINGTAAHHIVFAGHTHVRHARDNFGPIDISLGRIRLRRDRHYLINPGAVTEGQFVIWDRLTANVLFERV